MDNEHKKKVRDIKFAVIIVSDTRDFESDESGKIIMNLIKKNGYEVKEYDIIKNDEEQIKEKMEELMQQDIDAIIFSGGTGISKKDITVDTIKPMLEKELIGFGELFRWLSYEEIKSTAMMSRATAGIKNEKAIFCLPGSKNAVELAVKKLIIPEIGHILWEARK